MSTQINPAAVAFQLQVLMQSSAPIEAAPPKQKIGPMPETAVAVLDVLPWWPNAMTRVEMARATGYSESRVHAAMQLLRKRDYIKGTPKLGNIKSTYWRVK